MTEHVCRVTAGITIVAGETMITRHQQLLTNLTTYEIRMGEILGTFEVYIKGQGLVANRSNGVSVTACKSILQRRTYSVLAKARAGPKLATDRDTAMSVWCSLLNMPGRTPRKAPGRNGCGYLFQLLFQRTSN
jgi:hypothetical protein